MPRSSSHVAIWTLAALLLPSALTVLETNAAFLAAPVGPYPHYCIPVGICEPHCLYGQDEMGCTFCNCNGCAPCPSGCYEALGPNDPENACPECRINCPYLW